ncbi:MBL fold metallo-hydrolase [Microbacterium sp. M3]|uniref:MBL fold metallo-hydrolase n=1 Tax=Microbacterium arthrosphaerae TaxID=792652 RepID=A0ABU4H2K1_9MICO|nr:MULTISPECIES: MBL fold metallo-hydrolase [Microbacterium]MDW4573556.1 MBL fold metallo-hydrolase [Microbacterium arthrosphaerae]MDW7607411.1 MBL fold metallo-hydrolase [Microbacterium sp. M3]
MARERPGVTTVADGVLRIQRAGVNCYLLAASDGLTLIDAGLPGMWRLLLQALQSLGAAPADLTAVVLTHGHFDHVGLSDRLRHDHGVASHIHHADAVLARHPYRYDHQAPRWRYPFRYPANLPLLTSLIAAGALTVEGTKTKNGVEPGTPMPVPGRLVPIWSPGHTNGHCGFLHEASGALFSGDALVTLDPYTGRVGPRLVARAATADAEMNLLSLDRLAVTDASLVLPGHGLPYEGGVRDAVAHARRAGVA